MIHIVDHRNVAIYADNCESAERYIGSAAKLESIGSIKNISPPTKDGNLFYIVDIRSNGQIAECLSIVRAEHFRNLNTILHGRTEAIPVDAWLCTPTGPLSPESNRPSQANGRLWTAALEQCIQSGDRTVATVMDPWRYAAARRSGLPWRKIADIHERLVLAALDANQALVRRLASHFGSAFPHAYHVDETDLAVWGSLGRVAQEFDQLQRLTNRALADRQPPLGAGRR